jgi:hypothetical protein
MLHLPTHATCLGTPTLADLEDGELLPGTPTWARYRWKQPAGACDPQQQLQQRRAEEFSEALTAAQGAVAAQQQRQQMLEAHEAARQGAHPALQRARYVCLQMGASRARLAGLLPRTAEALTIDALRSGLLFRCVGQRRVGDALGGAAASQLACGPAAGRPVWPASAELQSSTLVLLAACTQGEPIC